MPGLEAEVLFEDEEECVCLPARIRHPRQRDVLLGSRHVAIAESWECPCTLSPERTPTSLDLRRADM